MDEREERRQAKEAWRTAKEEMREARRQTVEAWRKAADEMREAMRQAWREGHFDDVQWRESFEEFIQSLVAKTKDFGREVGEDAGRFGRSVAEDARRQAETTWKNVGEEWSRRKEYHHGPPRRDWQEHWLFGGRRFQHWAEGDVEANPFLNAMFSKGGGLLSLYLLHLLAEQPRHGNDLMKEIERRTLGGWTSNPGAVYPLLSDMESNGLVLSKWEEPDKRTRRIYEITDKGRDELARLKQLFRPKLMDTIDALHDIYDDLYASNDQGGASGANSSAGSDQQSTPQDQGESGTQQSEMSATEPSESQPKSSPRSFLGRLLGPGFGHATQTG